MWPILLMGSMGKNLFHRKRPVEFRFPGGGNGKSPELSLFGFGAREQLIHGGLKEGYPMIKIFGFEGMFLVQIEVFLDRIATIAVGIAQQEKFPEGVHDW